MKLKQKQLELVSYFYKFITFLFLQFILFFFRKPPIMNLQSSNEDKPSILADRRNIYDNDEFDVFSRTDVNMENIHIGKK